MTTDTFPFDIYESTQKLGGELTLWRMGMHHGYALLIYVDDSVVHMCEFGDAFDHEWDSPVTLHYAQTGWDT